MKNTRQTLKNGIYLVVDPAMDRPQLLRALRAALRSQTLAAVQVWDHWPDDLPVPSLLHDICNDAHEHSVPVLANNHWQLLLDYPLDGVHFDTLPPDLPVIKKSIGRPIITGITLGNDLGILEQAHAGELDYLSFCSMFPSSSAQDCEIVRPEVVKAARALTEIPLFLAGGIHAANLSQLSGLPYDGIAVISGIMHADNPEEASRNLYQSIQQLKTQTT